MTDISQWSTSAASNNTASPDGFPEGMAPSGVNDSAREVMAAVARWHQDTDASLTSGGSSNAYTLTTNSTHAALADMAITAFKANHANTGAATLNVDTLGAISLKKNHDQALASGDIEVDQIVVVLYDGTNYQILSPLAQVISSNEPFIPRGLKLSNDTDTDHDINVTAGGSMDATNANSMTLATEITKQIDAAWAVGDDAGGLDGSESVAGTPDASTLNAVWLIKRSDTGVVDMLFSESFTSPTMPTNYDFKRLIGAYKTDSSANVIASTWVGSYCRYTGDVIQDVSDGSITSDTFEVAALSAPPSSLAHIYASAVDSSGGQLNARVHVKTNGAADAASAAEAFGGVHGDTGASRGIDSNGMVLLDSSSQVQYTAVEVSVAVTVTIRTFGFTMLTRNDP